MVSFVAGNDCSGWANKYPEWWGYLIDSILLERLGIGAAQMFEMPTDSPSWRNAQRTLAYKWKQADMVIASQTVKLG